MTDETLEKTNASETRAVVDFSTLNQRTAEKLLEKTMLAIGQIEFSPETVEITKDFFRGKANKRQIIAAMVAQATINLNF